MLQADPLSLLALHQIIQSSGDYKAESTKTDGENKAATDYKKVFHIKLLLKQLWMDALRIYVLLNRQHPLSYHEASVSVLLLSGWQLLL